MLKGAEALTQKLVFPQISRVRAAGGRGSHSLLGGTFDLRGLLVIGSLGGVAAWKKGATPWSGAKVLQKGATAGLASRRQKAWRGLAWAMSQRAKNYKIRQPPPLPGRKTCKRQDSPCNELVPQLHHPRGRSGLHPSVQVPPASIAFLSCHFERNSPQTRAVPFSIGKEALDSLAIS